MWRRYETASGKPLIEVLPGDQQRTMLQRSSLSDPRRPPDRDALGDTVACFAPKSIPVEAPCTPIAAREPPLALHTLLSRSELIAPGGHLLAFGAQPQCQGDAFDVHGRIIDGSYRGSLGRSGPIGGMRIIKKRGANHIKNERR